jgi:hypothetical protein
MLDYLPGIPRRLLQQGCCRNSKQGHTFMGERWRKIART